jgi:hypothetical protein
MRCDARTGNSDTDIEDGVMDSQGNCIHRTHGIDCSQRTVRCDIGSDAM